MNDSRSQSGSRHERPGPTSRTAAVAALLAALVMLALGAALADEPPAANPDSTGTLGVDSPIGRIDYYPGRGLRLGDARITLGGFTKAEVERLEGGDSSGGLEGPNFFLFFDPLPFVHAFSELETGTLVGAQTGQKGVRTNLALGVERAYGDFGASDAATLRFGKFLTPVGRWNTILAEPLTWTTSTPLIVEDVFDESTTGARFWADGAPVVPLNLPSASPLREQFSRLVLRETETRLADYWNRLYFRGILPPATLVSTESVRRYVASDPNAIGYVPDSEVDGSVRVLLRLE